jgi:hypothetical protein
MEKTIPKGVFAFRVKIGEYEVEISGEHGEVLSTIKDLPDLMNEVQKAFEASKPKTKATITVKTQAKKGKAKAQKYPQIYNPESCSEAILGLLATDWGKWRPRTVDELKEALKANGLEYPGRTLAGVLLSLVNKGQVKRWRTDDGCVYILAEEEILA